MKNGDFASQLSNEDHVMFNDDDRVLACQAEKKFAGLRRFLIGHASCRFVNEEELRVLREQHSDLEPLLLPMRQISGLNVGSIFEANDLQHLEYSFALRGGYASEN